MTKAEFLRLIDELIEVEPGTLTGNEVVRDLEGWDSLKLVELIALLDERFNIPLSAESLVKCKTVNDMIALLGDGVTP